MTFTEQAPVTPASSAERRGAKSRWRRAHSLAAALAVGAAAFAVAPAQSASAVATCQNGALPTTFPANADPGLNVWDVEGKITAVNTTNNTITANGMTFTVPSTLAIKTQSLDQQTGNATFAEAFGPGSGLDSGTVIANGTTDFVPATDNVTGAVVANSYCMTLTATSVFSEVAENLIIGPLMSVDQAAGTFVVNGVTVRMNTNPLFTSAMTDPGGNALTMADLASNLGALTDVSGYYDAASRTMVATVVEADVVKVGVGKDSVQVQRAQHASGQLRVGGIVGRFNGNGSLAPTVQVFNGTVNADGTGCTGTQLGNATVSAADGSFDYRRNIATAPTSVCVFSPIIRDAAGNQTGGGGVDDLIVTRK